MQSGLTLENNMVKLLFCFVYSSIVENYTISTVFLLKSLPETPILESQCTPLHTLKDCASFYAHSLRSSSSALGESSLCNKCIQLGSWVSWRTSRPYTAALLSGRGHSFALFFFSLRALWRLNASGTSQTSSRSSGQGGCSGCCGVSRLTSPAWLA